MENRLPKLRFPEFASSLAALKLDDVVAFKSGGTPSKENESYWNGDIPWISAASMQGKYYSKSDRTITEEGLKKGSKLAAKGSLLLLVRGSMLFNKIPIGIAERDVAFNQDLKSLIVNKKSNTEYLYQWFSSNENLILDKVVGTGIGAGKLDTDDLKNLKINLPTLPEQTKIASFLTAVDEKLTALKKKKTLLEQYKKGVMQQIFSQQLRFKDDNGNNFADWEEKKLGEITAIKKGKQLNKIELTETGKYLCINGGISPSGYTDNFNTLENTITISEGGNSCGFVNFFKCKFWSGGHNYSIEILNQNLTSNNFLYQLLKYRQPEIMSLRVGSGLPNIQKKDLVLFIFEFPNSIEEQTKIANFLSAIDEKISQCQKQIEKTEVWKKGLLQQLFV
jgi:type I restriction enzyme S subunit